MNHDWNTESTNLYYKVLQEICGMPLKILWTYTCNPSLCKTYIAKTTLRTSLSICRLTIQHTTPIKFNVWDRKEFELNFSYTCTAILNFSIFDDDLRAYSSHDLMDVSPVRYSAPENFQHAFTDLVPVFRVEVFTIWYYHVFQTVSSRTSELLIICRV